MCSPPKTPNELGKRCGTVGRAIVRSFFKLYSHLKCATYVPFSMQHQPTCSRWWQTALAMDDRREEHINTAVDASVRSAARSLCAAHLVHTLIHSHRPAALAPGNGRWRRRRALKMRMSAGISYCRISPVSHGIYGISLYPVISRARIL